MLPTLELSQNVMERGLADGLEFKGRKCQDTHTDQLPFARQSMRDDFQQGACPQIAWWSLRFALRFGARLSQAQRDARADADICHS